MPDEKPILYLAHGDDLFAIQSFERDLVAHMGDDPGMVELNVTRLDGRHARLEDLAAAAQTLPFLAERRMVILAHAQDLARGEAAQKRLIALLDTLPASTALVIGLPDDAEGGEKKIKAFKTRLLKWAQAAGPRAFVREFRLPVQAAMPGWILERAKQAGGRFERGAAELLATSIGNDTAAAAQEIDKLLTYVDYSRPVEAEDVQALTPASSQTTVFELVDRMAEGDTRQALRSLR
ncbi:MAG TPA: DNA polymerase III subunit delta, partial [Anaerolineaceae bacterium]|nr:DNA polymerase III subunit delta [Anaerolineaceae bacterium]